MIVLDTLLACPICHAELPLPELRQMGSGKCPGCARQFGLEKGILNLTPVPPPDADVLATWTLWQKLQRNGLISYEQDPLHNLSLGDRKDAEAFARFCKLSGLVLDVGCGPQRGKPSYAAGIEEYIGIDPLGGVQPRDFTFVQAIAEYLPFRAKVFDRVVFATSLDHMLSPQRALAEARRVVRYGGRINIWFYDSTRRERRIDVWAGRARVAATLVREGQMGELWHRFTRRTLQRPTTSAEDVAAAEVQPPRYLAELSTPDGAIDQFHFFHPSEALVEEWLREANLRVVRTKPFDVNHVFVEAKAGHDARSTVR